MDTLKNAIRLLQEAKQTKQLGVIHFLDEEDGLKFIAQQAQDIDNNGNRYIGGTNKFAYAGAVNQFGEPLVNAAIELYNS
jgi:hypothetical protein